MLPTPILTPPRAKAEAVLAKSEIPSRSRIGALSRGMAAQLHLALVMAVDAKLLILDEPTLGLDIVFRKRFYDALLTDYFDASRSIVLATHQVDEVQDILTDILYVDRGRVVLQCSMDEFVSRYLEVRVRREDVDRARALGPLHERQGVGHTIFLFDRGNMESIAALGEARTPNIADLVIALSGDRGALRTGSRHVNTPSQAGPQPMTSIRPFYWSVRRELWENRWVYLAPIIVAGVVLIACDIATIVLIARSRNGVPVDAAALQAGILGRFDIAYRMILLTGFAVAFFYCADALYGERRDRSVLFWRSLPVSDLTTVLSKAAVPLVVVPLLTFSFLILGSVSLRLLDATAVPTHVISVVAAGTLLQAPLFGWLLLVSAVAKRAPMLWAVLPPVVVGILETITLRTSYIAELTSSRGLGAYWQSFRASGQPTILGDVLGRPIPGAFFLTLNLWLGVVAAAAFVAAAVRLRRRHGPI